MLATTSPAEESGTGQAGETVPTEGERMTGEKVDRRVRRTKQLLRSALLALITEKGYARITVQDIIDRADVGRSTFYTHFRDKEDLLVYGLEELRSAFRPELHAFDPTQPQQAASPTLAVFEHFASYRDVWKAMAGRRGADTFTHYLHGLLSELLRDQLHARAPDHDTQVPLDALVEFAASTLIGIGMRWWLANDLPHTPQEIDQIYQRLTEPAIHAGLQPRH